MRALLLFALAGCSVPDFVHPPGPPVIERFTVTPFELRAGGTVTIEWRVSGAGEITLTGAGAPQSLPAEGSLEHTLDASASFELIATGKGGSSRAIAEARVAELEEVQIIRFEVSPSLVEPDDPVRVVWRTESSTRVVIRLSSGETLIDRAPEAGSLVFRPREDVTLRLSAEGWPEPKEAVRTVRASPDGPTIVRFSAVPPVVPLQDLLGLEWEVANTDRVRLYSMSGTSSVAIYETEPAAGTGYLPLILDAGSHTFLLEATNSVGTVVEAATAFVIPETPPEIISLTATPTITGRGGDVVVRYATRFTDRVQLWVNGALLLAEGPQSGSYVYARVPDGVLSFELVAESFSRAIEERSVVSVVVNADYPWIQLLAAIPYQLAPGETAQIAWNVYNSDLNTLDTDGGAILQQVESPSGDLLFTPDRDVDIRLTAVNDRGTTIAYAPLRVRPVPQIVEFTSDVSVARFGRPVRFTWSTLDAERIVFSFENTLDVAPLGTLRQYTDQLGVMTASLQVTNSSPIAGTSSIAIQVIAATDDIVELEPNDSEALAGGPYFTFPGSIEGSVAGNDADLYELFPALGARIEFATAPQAGCSDGVAVEVYEVDPQLGLLGPRLTIDGPAVCASADAIDAPILASLEPPLFVRVRRPSGTSTVAASPYLLSFDSRTGFCSDGIVDLFEACDDDNLVSNDGCSASCTLEDLDELEPNDTILTPIALDTSIRAHLSYDDVDRYRFQILTPAEAGPRSILLEAPNPGACMLDAELILRDGNGVELARDDNDGLGCPILDGPATILTQGVYELEVRAGRGVILPRKERYVFSVR